jgi:hypothetical protein
MLELHPPQMKLARRATLGFFSPYTHCVSAHAALVQIARPEPTAFVTLWTGHINF